ncbi:MAG TPA: hypothetical protein VMU90_12120 [Solirubrobacteraceae bacterium]|nr:hypothetical protein [Solirubrobacteraceae bacterium]
MGLLQRQAGACQSPKITVDGTSAGLIAITAADGKQHQQPLIEPVDFFDSQ